MPGRGSKARRMKRMKASGDYKIEWYKPYTAKAGGVCTRCTRSFPADSLVNGDYKWPMHVDCWDAHVKERSGK